jgi:hypothetical protein
MLALASPAYAFDPSILGFFTNKVVDQVCSDGGAWLKCYRIDPAACHKLAHSLVDPCADEVFGSVREQLPFEKAPEFAQKFQDCFNKSFEKNYGERQSKAPECVNPPKHLQSK